MTPRKRCYWLREQTMYRKRGQYNVVKVWYREQMQFKERRALSIAKVRLIELRLKLSTSTAFCIQQLATFGMFLHNNMSHNAIEQGNQSTMLANCDISKTLHYRDSNDEKNYNSQLFQKMMMNYHLILIKTNSSYCHSCYYCTILA